MKIHLILFLIMAACLPVLASQERIIQPYEVTISANAGKPFGDVTVGIKTDKKPENSTITSIRLKINGDWKDVPKKAFSDLKSPLLNQLKIRTEAGYDKNPWLYIYFELSHEDKNGKWRPKGVHIAYHKGKFESRSITIPIDESESKWDKMEL